MKNIDRDNIIHKYFKRLDKYGSQAKKELDENSIHHFRTTVKKMRAFLRLMRTGDEESDRLKFPHKFKKMYSLMGEIRDRQLCIKRIKEYGKDKKKSFTNKVNDLKKEIKELSKKKDEFLSKKQMTGIEESVIKEAPAIRGDTVVRNFFQDQMDITNVIVSAGRYSDNEIHGVRKKLKDILYITAIFQDDMKKRLPVSLGNKSELKKAEGLTDKLGLFNDAVNSLAFVEPADIKAASSPEKENLRGLRNQWLAEKRKLKKEIMNEILAIRFDKLAG